MVNTFSSYPITGELTVGLMKPMGLLPRASRASLIIVKIAPATGAEQDVPYASMTRNSPLTCAVKRRNRTHPTRAA